MEDIVNCEYLMDKEDYDVRRQGCSLDMEDLVDWEDRGFMEGSNNGEDFMDMGG